MPARGGQRSTIFVGAMSRSKQLRGFRTLSAYGFAQTHGYAPRSYASQRFPDRLPGSITIARGTARDEHLISHHKNSRIIGPQGHQASLSKARPATVLQVV